MFCIWTSWVGLTAFATIYLVPWMMTNHWIVMLTYLHHSDPTIPYYRNNEWTFLRGAIATVDRPLLGWIRRIFLHNVSHNHSTEPNRVLFLRQSTTCNGSNQESASTNTFRALYRTFTQCKFIEDKGDIVFYKNREGRAARVLATSFQATRTVYEIRDSDFLDRTPTHIEDLL
ncbi:delta-12 fatty acid desaturase protein [Moniliophthora roreri]|nr:delta-12 fatty acid desaturase protein [Moniliophthora roreri]